MTNIKNIGKQLMGESLNAFHRKVGLESIEKNNEMQSKVLQGIYSQVDDNYLEKTEESNVIHLDGSGDGVVEIDSVEGNSLVNIFKNVTGTVSLDNVVSSYTNNTLSYKAQSGFEGNIYPAFLGNFIPTYDLVHNKDYVFVFDCNIEGADFGLQGVKIDSQWVSGTTFKTLTKKGRNTIKFTTPNDLSEVVSFKFRLYNSTTNNEHLFSHFKLFEGNNIVEPSSYFEGMQSSFEEKKVDDKYEIEISLNNKNLFDTNKIVYNKWLDSTNNVGIGTGSSETRNYLDYVKVKGGTTIKVSGVDITAFYIYSDIGSCIKTITHSNWVYTIPSNVKYIRFTFDNTKDFSKAQVEYGDKTTVYTPQKLNKIKLLINEPLRKNDRLCVLDNKLVVERNSKQLLLNGVDELYGNWNWNIASSDGNITRFFLHPYTEKAIGTNNIICDKMPTNNSGEFTEGIGGYTSDGRIYIKLLNTKADTVSGLKTYLANNPHKVLFDLAEPYYEEVINEYGEPILLEGYENGTLFIDSVIVPTTSVRYTQKFESRNELKNLNKNNILITKDINYDIVPYMMEVDMMIMEKEMALMSQLNTNNIMKMEVLDMTSMQKRTFDMLKRLIEGKTLTEQECKERVLVYLEADKITAEQANELMLIIAEKYS